jgi:hypothetical protein
VGRGTTKKSLKQIESFNKKNPVGTPVRYWPGVKQGAGVESKTRSEAWDLCGSPSVMVEGYSGGIALTHVEVMQ